MASRTLFKSRMPARPPRAAAAPVIAAVLESADVTEDLGNGRVLHRLSRRALNDPDVKARLGEAVRRAAALAVIWNEREGQIERVLETPLPSRKQRFDEDDDAVWALRGMAA